MFFSFYFSGSSFIIIATQRYQIYGFVFLLPSTGAFFSLLRAVTGCACLFFTDLISYIPDHGIYLMFKLLGFYFPLSFYYACYPLLLTLVLFPVPPQICSFSESQISGVRRSSPSHGQSYRISSKQILAY